MALSVEEVWRHRPLVRNFDIRNPDNWMVWKNSVLSIDGSLCEELDADRGALVKRCVSVFSWSQLFPRLQRSVGWQMRCNSLFLH